MRRSKIQYPCLQNLDCGHGMSLSLSLSSPNHLLNCILVKSPGLKSNRKATNQHKKIICVTPPQKATQTISQELTDRDLWFLYPAEAGG